MICSLKVTGTSVPEIQKPEPSRKGDTLVALRWTIIHRDYLPFLTEDGLKGARLGVPNSLMGFNLQVDQLMIAALVLMEKQGAELIR